MQVSNSTGSSTDYRVGTSSGSGAAMMSDNAGTASGVQASPGSPGGGMLVDDGGTLPPGNSATWNGDGPFTVEFQINGVVVASESFLEDPGQVTLVETAEGFAIETSAGVSA